MAAPDLPFTIGTAGHVDHGKTTLVEALTGVNTDRLPEERRRGLSIALGYAALRLPSGRPCSIVDVPGHERFVRTMVAGATGVDAYLLTVAADDGVMPQTVEHVTVLRGLAVAQGVVAITKADVADPAPARAAVAELLPGVPAIAVSAPARRGLRELVGTLDELAARVPARADSGDVPVMHIDRAFTIRGAGTVVTGTLQRGSVGRGDRLRLLPRGESVRVRGVQVHDEPRERAQAGQRVAVNLARIGLGDVARGDVLAGDTSPLEPAQALDAELDVPVDGVRVQVHHGTRETPARARRLDGSLHRLRLERPLIAAPGDRLVVRWISPPGTAGGGLVVAAYPPGAVPRGRSRARPGAAAPTPAAGTEQGHAGAAAAPSGASASPSRPPTAAPAPALDADALALEERLRAAGNEPPLDAELDERALAALREAGRAVRVGRTLHFHVDALAGIERTVRAIIEAEGQITLPRLRDELDTSRKFSQALLEHFDAARVTRRLPDNSRVLRRYSARGPTWTRRW
jgi:selenocysteine-specific elongation factor